MSLPKKKDFLNIKSTPVSGSLANETFTDEIDEIAYLVPCDDVVDWLNQESGISLIEQKIESAAGVNNDTNLMFLGIQIEFKKPKLDDDKKPIFTDDDKPVKVPVKFLTISQLFFEKNTKKFYSALIPKPDSAAKKYYAIEKDHVRKIEINKKGTIEFLAELSHYSIKEGISTLPDEHFSYKKLSLYNEDGIPGDKTHLVFFPAFDVEMLTKYYKDLVISGSRINPGKKLLHKVNEESLYKGSYFTLKIEGNSLKDFSLPGARHAVSNAEGPGFINGLACPPDWDAKASITSLILREPDIELSLLDINQISKNWVEHSVNSISIATPPIIPFDDDLDS